MAFFLEQRKNVIDVLFENIVKENNISKDNDVFIYGEGCGEKIKKGVAISGLNKMFLVFGVKVKPHDENIPSYWLDFKFHSLCQSDIYDIKTFGTYTIDIDFNNPKLYQNKLKELTEQVEKECPIGKYFGRVLGKDNTTGVGIVWTGYFKDSKYMFKVKGEKHSSSKVKKIAEVDVEKLNSINEFVEYAVSENRLNQAIEQVFTSESIEPCKERTSDFLKWLVSDVIKEELDTLTENGLEPKEVTKACSCKARKWFFEYLDKIMW